MDLKAALESARELEKLAKRKGIPIAEPFAGTQLYDCGGFLTVLGPTQQFYEALLTDFRSTPEKKEAYSLVSNMLKSLQEGAVAVAKRVVPAAATLLNAALASLWVLRVNDRWVKAAAEAYADRLVRAYLMKTETNSNAAA